MEEKRGKFKLFYSTGAVAVFGGITDEDAKKLAREKAEKEDPGIILVKVTDKGGVQISYDS